jgi:hypothetical protein
MNAPSTISGALGGEDGYNVESENLKSADQRFYDTPGDARSQQPNSAGMGSPHDILLKFEGPRQVLIASTTAKAVFRAPAPWTLTCASVHDGEARTVLVTAILDSRRE